MIEKRTVIDQIEITRSGHIHVRFCLLLVDDGVEISSSYHRTAIEPGGDVDSQVALVNTDITTRPTLRAAAIDGDKIPLLKEVCRLAHTPEVVNEHKARVKLREYQETLATEAKMRGARQP